MEIGDVFELRESIEFFPGECLRIFHQPADFEAPIFQRDFWFNAEIENRKAGVRCWPGGRRSVERSPSRTGGFPGRIGDFSLPDIWRAQLSLRSIRLGFGVATIGILTAEHTDCADILPKCGNADRIRDQRSEEVGEQTGFHPG